MASLWPWLAIAGVGALHGLNPASGWLLAAAWGVRSGERAVLRALLPIACGHLASVALVAAAVLWGLAMDRTLAQVFAAVLCAVALGLHFWRRSPHLLRAPAGQAGLALWSFAMATAHGAGLMLVPALLPLCLVEGSAGDWDSLGLALAAVAVHTAAMLAVTGLAASGARRAWRALRRAATAQAQAARRS